MDGFSGPSGAMEPSTLSFDRESDNELKRRLSILFQMHSREWIKRNPRVKLAAYVPPMDFHWQFSELYPRFPLLTSFDEGYIPREISFWKREDVISCIQALTNGNLRIVAKQRTVLPQERPSAPMPNITAATMNLVPACPDLSVMIPSSSEGAIQPAEASASHDHATNDELVGKVRKIMETLNTVMYQASKSRRELEESQRKLEESQKELKHHRQQLPLQLEAAHERGRNLSLELVLGKKEDREQALTEKLSASVARSRNLVIENKELRDEVEKLRRVLKDVRARPTYGEERIHGLSGSTARSHQEETATSLSPHDIYAKYDGLGSWPDEPDEIKGDPGSLSRHATVNEHIKAMREPLVLLVPNLMRKFPMKFVQQRVGGDYSVMTSSNRAAEPEVEWQQIHFDPAFHKRCPTRLKNGALVHVVGCPAAGKIGQTYALWRKETAGFTKYIGHYKIMEKVIMPFRVWKQDFSLDMRRSLVNDILNHSWGRDLLHSRGIDVSHEADHDNIVKLFESENEPRLRMFWSILQFDSFQLDDYNKLLRAAKLPGPVDWPTSMGFGADSMMLGQDTKSEFGVDQKSSNKRLNEEYNAPDISQSWNSEDSRASVRPGDMSIGSVGGRADSANDSMGSYSPVAKRSRVSEGEIKKEDIKEEDVIPDSQESKDIARSQDVTESPLMAFSEIAQ